MLAGLVRLRPERVERACRITKPFDLSDSWRKFSIAGQKPSNKAGRTETARRTKWVVAMSVVGNVRVFPFQNTPYWRKRRKKPCGIEAERAAPYVDSHESALFRAAMQA